MIKIPLFKNAKVLVVGDMILDRYLLGPIHRISPEAPVPVIEINQVDEKLGGAANVALNIKELGAQVTLLGMVGQDKEADILSDLLLKAQIHVNLIRSEHPTIHKTRIISSHQQLIRLDIEKKYQPCKEAFLKTYESLLSNIDIIVLSDYAKGTLCYSQELISLAKSKSIPVLVDPKSKDWTSYEQATLITPNTKEFEGIAGPCDNEKDIVEKGTQLLSQYSLSALLITRGIDGMMLLTREHPPLILKALAQEVFDVTGAGDTVIATLATSLAAGSDLNTAVVLSNTAAAISVRKRGTSTVSTHELRRQLQLQYHLNSSILSEEDLMTAVLDAKAHGEKIVMTNGCFDLLHAGHVNYLEEAKAFGERLIIAVNDDASVSRLKGEERPINELEHRMTVLSALRAVDWVVAFSEDTPTRLIELIKPDVLVKGGDYAEEQIAGASFVRSYGGDVKILPFFSNCSTTNTLKKIKKTIKEKVAHL